MTPNRLLAKSDFNGYYARNLDISMQIDNYFDAHLTTAPRES